MDFDESRYSHLLLTNDEPPDMEIPEIRKIIAHRQSNLSQLIVRITELQDILNSLIERRNQDEQRLSLFRGVLSPLRRLPRDIIMEIFMFTRDWRPQNNLRSEFKSSPVGPLPTPSPLAITHICSEWRRVALGMPMLWATIIANHRNYRPSVPKSIPAHNKPFHAWLARTGSYYPLDITFTGPLPYTTDNGAPLSCIQSYMHRIKILNLAGVLCELPNGCYDVLETLSMVNCLMHLDMDPLAFFPSLRRFVLYERDEIFELPPLPIPYHQLTHLSIDAEAVDPLVLRLMLPQSASLVKLHTSILSVEVIDHDHIQVPIVAEGDPIVLSHLNTLIVHGDVGWLLDNLTLPALENLDLSFEFWPAQLYRSFQSRSSFALKSLTLGRGAGIRLTSPVFFDLICGMPSLTEVISNIAVEVTPVLIQSLALLDLTPNLEYLKLCWDARILVDDVEFIHMLASRDLSGNPAITEPSPPRDSRIFTSHTPKRRWNGKPLDDEPGEYVMYGQETVYIYF